MRIIWSQHNTNYALNKDEEKKIMRIWQWMSNSSSSISDRRRRALRTWIPLCITYISHRASPKAHNSMHCVGMKYIYIYNEWCLCLVRLSISISLPLSASLTYSKHTAVPGTQTNHNRVRVFLKWKKTISLFIQHSTYISSTIASIACAI